MQYIYIPEQRMTLPTRMSLSVMVSMVEDVDAMVYGSGPGVPRAVTTPNGSRGCLQIPSAPTTQLYCSFWCHWKRGREGRRKHGYVNNGGTCIVCKLQRTG